MASITHPSMRKSSPVQTQPVQKKEVYVVDDLSEFEGKPEPEIEAPVKKEQPKVSSENRKVIEDLLFLGRVSKDIEISGHVFSLSTLSHGEYNTLLKILGAITDPTSVFEVRTYTLALAVKSIDGVDLDSIEVGGEFSSDVERKAAFFDNLQLKLIERLFEEYTKMVEETEKTVTNEEIKK